ncbi:MAG: hypothetical protein ACTHN0_19710, partial [Aquihabitans sp.]
MEVEGVAAADGDVSDVPRLPRWMVGVLVGFGLALFAGSMVNPFAFVPDDALFYLVIGRNIVA